MLPCNKPDPVTISDTFFGFFMANFPLLVIAWTGLFGLDSPDTYTYPGYRPSQITGVN